LMNTYNPTTDILTVEYSAVIHFQNIIQNTQNQGVRLTLKPSGCAGFSYVWELVNQPEPTDLLVFSTGFMIWTNAESMKFIVNSVIRYESSLAGGQIVVDSPRAENSCGCGESVSFDL
jgi:Fe-S cluster assembly protein SufA